MKKVPRIPKPSIPNINVDLNTIKFAFQPIFDAKTGNIYGYEALMRPDECSPLELIHAYEKTGHLRYIEEATLYYGTKAFLDADLEGYLFLNSIPGTCMSVEMAIATAELGGDKMAKRFYIEILEYTKYNSAVWDFKKKAIFGTGASPKIAIDDFGTGEHIDSECIEIYKPDLVKIDRKYISQIESNTEHQQLLKDMTKWLHNRGISTLAEGVETKAEYDYLKTLDIDYMQGFYLGMPKIYS